MSNPVMVIPAFRLLYTFHPANATPTTLADGLFNCSVGHYHTFQYHLRCNMVTECEGREDEKHCPFSSQDCPGMVASRNKCFFHVPAPSQQQTNSSPTAPAAAAAQELTGATPQELTGAAEACRRHGGHPAVIRTHAETTEIRKLLSRSKPFQAYMLSFYKHPIYVRTVDFKMH
jgi:hypothetical protein